MLDPYAVLDLASHASLDEVRARYLQLVRENPPERAPERFAEIRAAYEELRDPARQLADQIFTFRTRETMDGLRAAVRSKLVNERLTLPSLLALADQT